MPSTTVIQVCEDFQQREAVGIKKYGTTVDRGDLTQGEWLKHLREELMDATLYVSRAIDTEAQYQHAYLNLIETIEMYLLKDASLRHADVAYLEAWLRMLTQNSRRGLEETQQK